MAIEPTGLSTWAQRPRQTPWTGHRSKRHGDGTAYYCPPCEAWHRGRAHPDGYEPCPQEAPRPEPGTTPLPSTIRVQRARRVIPFTPPG